MNSKKTPVKEWDPQTKVYFIVPQGTNLKHTLGVQTKVEALTFAFTSVEKVQAFLDRQYSMRKMAIKKDIITYWMTLEEYFSKPDNNNLYIDPPEDFPVDFPLPNLN